VRARAEEGGLSVHAVAGTYVVLLGIDVAEGSPRLRGLLGFALHRKNHSDGEEGWLDGIKTFARAGRTPHPARLVSTREHPLQGFLWGDYAAQAGRRYTYRVAPVYGSPGRVREGDAVEVEVDTEPEASGVHSIYFNRGAAASQAYARRFKNRPPDRGRNPEAYPWLSRGLEEALLAFVDRAGPGSGLRAAVYEFHYDRALEAFARAARRGVDVRIVCDAKRGALKPRERNLSAIDAAGIAPLCTFREANASYIAHNKFIVRLDRGRPTAVWTGSTNVTEGGIFGHSNLAHVVRDPSVARSFLGYWKELAGDPEARELRRWNDRTTPTPSARPRRGITALFSPRGSVGALEYYARLMREARAGVFFTAAFGVNRRLREVLATDRPFLRYLLLEKEDKADPRDPDVALYRRDRENLIAVGSRLTSNVLERWVQKNFAEEELTGQNKHVKYIHTKYMLLDPLGPDPIVVTGSANFSDASTRNNDENMLVIRGDTRVADIYLGEFMRLYTHYRFRAFAQQARRTGRPPRRLFLAPDDRWWRPYYDPRSVKKMERRLFS
jgi:phosphatidylserine/phosphatidylglycerophosphate/cardiolipin synthase-like enzyme